MRKHSFIPARERSLENIRDYLAYDAHTGQFTWLLAPRCGVCAGANAGSPDNRGYWIIKWGVRYKAHSLAMWFMTGAFPAVFADHLHRNRQDNRFEMLREATPSQNNMNRSPKKNGTSRFKGVTRIVGTDLWQAHIRQGGVSQNLGRFADERAAARAYDAEARRRFGEYAYINFPEEFRP